MAGFASATMRLNLWTTLTMTALAQLPFRRNENGLQLLVVVNGMAGNTGQACFAVSLSEICSMATCTALLNDFGGGSREALDFLRIATAVDMRRARSMTPLAALCFEVLIFHSDQMSRRGEGFVLFLVTSLATSAPTYLDESEFFGRSGDVWASKARHALPAQ